MNKLNRFILIKLRRLRNINIAGSVRNVQIFSDIRLHYLLAYNMQKWQNHILHLAF